MPRARRSLATTVVGGALGWMVTLGGLRAIVVQPEHCGDPSVEMLTESAAQAVRWFASNQHDDGTWLYRYDRSTDTPIDDYNFVRHAGVTMSLQQAATTGIPGAAASAQRGLEFALDNLYDGPGFQAFAPPDSLAGGLSTGASALLVAALVERRDRSGSTAYDAEMHELGAFLTAMVNERGQVLGRWDVDTGGPVPRSWNKYFTGETMWALALLHRAFGDAGYDETTIRIATYLATERDDVEGWWPDVPDHWAAYAFATLTTWPDPPPLDTAVDYLRRQMGFQSLQVRYESQRTNSWFSHHTRGRQTLGAGMGTIGEALDNWATVADAVPALNDESDAVRDRALCAAGAIADRQAEATDPAEDGAWFQFDVTQMDDQQHSLSALLLALPLAEREEENT